MLASPDATQTVGALGVVSFGGAGLAATVQAWLDGVADNDGWLLKIENESPLATAVRFGSREGSGGPQLTVEVTPPVPADRRSFGEVKNSYRGE